MPALHPGLLQAILDAPQDDTPRLVMADWLDDAGDPSRAEFIRVQVRLAQIGPPRVKVSPVHYKGGDVFLIEDTGDAYEVGQRVDAQPFKYLVRRHSDKYLSALRVDKVMPALRPTYPHFKDIRLVRDDFSKAFDVREERRLRKREGELLFPNRDAWFRCWMDEWDSMMGHDLLVNYYLKDHDDHDPASVRWERGFVANISMTADDCLKHLDSILAQHPVTRCRLTTWPRITAMFDLAGGKNPTSRAERWKEILEKRFNNKVEFELPKERTSDVPDIWEHAVAGVADGIPDYPGDPEDAERYEHGEFDIADPIGQ